MLGVHRAMTYHYAYHIRLVACSKERAWTIALLLDKPAGKYLRHGQNLEYTRPYTPYISGLSSGEAARSAQRGASIGFRIGVDRCTVPPGM